MRGRPWRAGDPLQARRLVRPALAAAGAAATLAVLLGGCAKMDATLDQQWVVVYFAPNTSLATALQVRAACSHIANAPPAPLPAKFTAVDILYGMRWDTTNASPANVAELQTCLQKYPSVQGFDPEDTGDEGG